MNKRLKSVFVGSVVFSALAFNSNANACSADAYMGSICTTAATFCPTGYLPAEGQTLLISDYNALFSLVGSLYGGDERITFALPDFRGRSAIGNGRGPGLETALLGSRRGKERIFLFPQQMPAHSHNAAAKTDVTSVIKATTNSANQLTPMSGDVLAVPAASSGPVGIYNSNSVGTVILGGVESAASTEVKVSPAGASDPAPVFIIPPQQVVKYCINVDGVYPPRS